jgi:cytochrome c556
MTAREGSVLRSKKVAAAGLMALLAVAGGVAGGVSAADDPANVIAYRQTVMKGIAAHITAVAMVAKGEVSFAGQVQAHAQAMAASARMIPDLFPAGTDSGKTEAKPEIWKEWDKFAAAAKSLEAEATKLAEVSAGGDVAAIGAQLGEVGKSCGGCHEPFRKKTAQ